MHEFAYYCIFILTLLFFAVFSGSLLPEWRKADIINGSLIIVYNGDIELPAKFRIVIDEAGYPEV